MPESFTPDGNFILGEAPEVPPEELRAALGAAGLVDAAGYEAAFGQPATVLGDFNADGLFDFDDIEPFVDALLGNPPAIPEPGAASMIALTAVVVMRRRRVG